MVLCVSKKSVKTLIHPGLSILKSISRRQVDQHFEDVSPLIQEASAVLTLLDIITLKANMCANIASFILTVQTKIHFKLFQS